MTVLSPRPASEKAVAADLSGPESPPAQVYSNLKALAYPDRLDALRHRRLAAPVNVRLKPINRCNHDCWYCAYRVSSLQLGQDMDLRDAIPRDKVFEIVEDIVTMGVKAVTFSGGGEPLLYKPLPECVERLAVGGVRVGALTNGSNLKGRVADAFAAHATWVRVSVDGWDGPSYARARHLPEDAFDRLIVNLKSFAARGSRCTLGASIIIGEDNHEHLYDLCRTLKDAGVQQIKLAGVIIGNDGTANNAYHRRLMPRVNQEIERAKSLDGDGCRVVNHYHLLAERFERRYHLCPTIQFTPVIGADCAVYTCQDKAYTEAGFLGSIKDRSFREFWFSEENRQRAFAINPAHDCPHNCACHEKNVLVTDFLATDEEHLVFV
jgi:MoaA/NifB/PqqE/SkfB family radical SAM enzyme